MTKKTNKKIQTKMITSLLDNMVDDREFESLLTYELGNINIPNEIKRSLAEIKKIREVPVICYMANVVRIGVKAPISIDNTDDLPFIEMIDSIGSNVKEVDVIVVTPGGSGEQVAKFVDTLRRRFELVNFIIPNIAMSAGTILAMSGNEIIMGENSYIGPIDPQIPNNNGRFVPAQAILTLIKTIQEEGQNLIDLGKNPNWTDLQILRQIDAKEIGNALNASAYSSELVEEYLFKYKFQNWKKHSDNIRIVTDQEKRERAKKISKQLCDHGLWKTHGRGISRDIAWTECQLKITHSESIQGLDRAMKRFWALMYFIFEKTLIYKVFISDNYSIFRSEVITNGGIGGKK